MSGCCTCTRSALIPNPGTNTTGADIADSTDSRSLVAVEHEESGAVRQRDMPTNPIALAPTASAKRCHSRSAMSVMSASKSLVGKYCSKSRYGTCPFLLAAIATATGSGMGVQYAGMFAATRGFAK